MAGKAKRAARTAAYKRRVMFKATERVLREGVKDHRAYYWKHASTAAPLRVSALEPVFCMSTRMVGGSTVEELVIVQGFSNWTRV